MRISCPRCRFEYDRSLPHCPQCGAICATLPEDPAALLRRQWETRRAATTEAESAYANGLLTAAAVCLGLGLTAPLFGYAIGIPLLFAVVFAAVRYFVLPNLTDELEPSNPPETSLTIPPIRDPRPVHVGRPSACVSESVGGFGHHGPVLSPDDPKQPSGECLLMLTASSCVSVDSVLWDAYLTALDQTARQYLEERVSSGLNVQIGCALLPGRRTLLEIHFSSEHTPPVLRQDLQDRLEQLPSLPVRGGPVAFVLQLEIQGGDRRDVRPMPPPFADLLRKYREGPLELQLLKASRDRFGPLPVDAGRDAQPTVADYSALLNCVPDYVPVYGARASAYLQSGEIVAALADLTRIVELEPEIVDAWVARGDCFSRLGRDDRALADYSQALKIDRVHARAWQQRVLLSLHRDRLDDALVDATAGIEACPKEPQLYVCRGIVHAVRGDDSAAAQDFNLAIFRRLDFGPAYLERARLFARRGRFERALEDARAAVRYMPENPAAYELRAALYSELRRFPEAQEDVSRQAALDPEGTAIGLPRARLYLKEGKYGLAAAELTTLLDRPMGPDEMEGRAAAYALRAYALYELDDFEPALADCQRAVELGDRSAMLYYTRALIHESSGDWNTALADLDTALAIDPNYAEAYGTRGTIRLQQQRAADAIEDFKAVIRLDPTAMAAYLHRGYAYSVAGEYEQALADYDQVIELAPAMAPAYTHRGLTHGRLKLFQQAEADITQAISLDPEFAPNYLERAKLRIRERDYHKAVDDLTAALRLEPEYAVVYQLRGQAWLESKEYDRALADFDELIRLCPALAAAYCDRGRAWIEMGEHDVALEDYAEAIRLEPSAADALTVHRLLAEASANYRRADFPGALARAAEALELDAQCAEAYVVLASAYRYLQKPREAIADYTKAIELADEPARVYQDRGLLSAELGEFEQALDDLDRALAMTETSLMPPNRALAVSGRAWVSMKLGRTEEAVRDFEQSRHLPPEDAWVSYYQGLTYQALGNGEVAAESFRQALDLNVPALTPQQQARARSYLEGSVTRMQDL